MEWQGGIISGDRVTLRTRPVDSDYLPDCILEGTAWGCVFRTLILILQNKFKDRRETKESIVECECTNKIPIRQVDMGVLI